MNYREFVVKKISSTVTVAFIVTAILLGTATITVVAADNTTVSINPSSQTVSPGDTFTVDVYCVPHQPIKAFEFKLSFDPSLLQADSVTEGNIFNGYTTIFNDGTINNTAGTIVDIYDLIVGAGNVSDAGTFVTISFTAKLISGVSSLNLYDIGIANYSGYVPIAVSNGSVTVGSQTAVFSGVTPSNGSTNVTISTSSVNLTIKDPEGDAFNWSIITSPNVGSSSGGYGSNGSKSCSISGLSYSTTYYWYVSCKDFGSGQWNNESYWFTTAAAPGGSNPPGNDEPPGRPPGKEEPEQNNPPNTPIKPSGTTSADQGMTYNYTSSAIDPDGDRVRLRFDWGNGTLSNWSAFVSSNTSVTMPHVWNSISTYNVCVIAQDENNTNSSWSASLSVTVSQAVSAGEPPVGDIKTSSNISTNQTVQFDASDSFDPDGVIVLYEWDFGDGETDTGITTNHTYKNPGQYTVTLVVTDNTSKTYSKSIIVTVAAGAEEKTKEKHDFLSSYLIIVLIVILIVIVLLLTLYFRGKKRTLLESRVVQEEKKKEQVVEENDSLISAPTPEDTIEKKADEILPPKTGNGIDKLQ